MTLKIPPVLVFIVFAAVMWFLAVFLPFGMFDFFGRKMISIGLAILGILIGGSSVVQFLIAKTTVHPVNLSNTSRLVTNGVYVFTRNPMYLALLLVLLAFGVWLSNAFNILVAAGFVSYMNTFQIQPEEKFLSEKFGSSYKGYCALTRRWF